MSSLIQQLENNEALLLMYVADELPAEDRAEVEQMLSQDRGMRAALSEIRSAHEGVLAGLAELDAADPAGTSASAEADALRRIGRATRQWTVKRLVAAPPPARHHRQFASWTIPAGVAAALLLGGVAIWGLHSPGGSDPARRVARTEAKPRITDGDTPAVAVKAEALRSSFATENSPALTEAEAEVTALARADEPAGATSAIFFGVDANR